MANSIRMRLLGSFEVEVDERRIEDATFERKQAASLVKLLALSTTQRLHREQVIDALWPELTIDEAAPRLHQTASYARKALGDKESIVLRDDNVLLWPDIETEIDVVLFEKAASLANYDEAANLYGGELLPSDPYEEWTNEPRERLRLRHLEILRSAERWEDVLSVEPADEAAHLALMRRFIDEGQRLSTLRQFERLEKALSDELGVSPSDEAIELRGQIVNDTKGQIELVNRFSERDQMQRALDEAQGGSGSLVLLTGAPGIGKTSLSEWIINRAEQLGFASGRSVAASVEGPGPYAPVLDAIDDLLRHSPELVEQLPETHRAELIRVRGAPRSSHVGPGDDDGHQRLFVAVDELIRLAARARGLVLFIDDIHAADEASLALLHYIARQANRERLLLVVSARSGVAPEALVGLRGLVGRHGARELKVGPFQKEHSLEMIQGLTDQDHPADVTEKILALAGGTPFYLAELSNSLATTPTESLPEHLTTIVASSYGDLPDDLREALTRVAVAGSRFDTDQFIGLSGLEEEAAFGLLDKGLDSEILELTSGGYQFRHGLVRESLLEGLAPHRIRVINRDAANRFKEMGAPPARIAHHLIEANQPTEAAPWALLAAKAAQAVGALKDARNTIEAVLEDAVDQTRLDLLALRGDVLTAMGDPGAVAAYQLALEETEGPMRRFLRASMARAALMGGDIASAQTAMAGLEPDGGMFDGPVLLAQGMLAYMTGDIASAEVAASEARQFALGESASTKMLDVLTLQGMVSHNKGEWFDRMRGELSSTADSTELAATVFDCHL